MNRLKSSWPLGIKADDLVFCRGEKKHGLARAIEFMPGIAEEFYCGQVPVLYLFQPEKHGVVWVPADDLELVVKSS